MYNRLLTVRNRDLPIPIHRPTPDTQEQDQNDDIADRGIRCDVFDSPMIFRQSLTRSSSCQPSFAPLITIHFKASGVQK